MPPTPADMPRQRPSSPAPTFRVEGRVVTRHARMRMTEFQLTARDVAQIICDYENRYATINRQGEAFVYQRGQWSVLVDETAGTVITILRRTTERWEH